MYKGGFEILQFFIKGMKKAFCNPFEMKKIFKDSANEF